MSDSHAPDAIPEPLTSADREPDAHSRSRLARFFVPFTALVVVAAMLNAVPAAALLFNDRPGVGDDASVAGAEFAPAAAEDDAAGDAADPELDEADWPAPATVALDEAQASQAEARAFTAPKGGDDDTVSLGPVTKRPATRGSPR